MADAAEFMAALTTHVSDDKRVVTFRLDNGGTLTMTSPNPTTWSPGDFGLWSVADQEVYKSPNALQFNTVPLQVGVVRKVTKTRVVIAVGETLYTTPLESPAAYEVGSTVEFRADVVIVRRISRKGKIPAIIDDILDAKGLGKNKVSTSSGIGETFDDFLGYESVKRKVREIVVSDEAFRKRLGVLKERPLNGVLFTGAPGTGRRSWLASWRMSRRQSSSRWVRLKSPANG